jgi:hypothetical protein
LSDDFGGRFSAVIFNSTDEPDISQHDWKAKWRAERTHNGWPNNAAKLQLRRGPGPNRPTNNVLTRAHGKGPWRRYGHIQEIHYDLYKPCKRTGDPSPNDLTRYRYYGPGLSAAEEADLIRQAQAGDRRAGRRLFEAFHRFVIKRAGNRNKSWFNYNNFDDLMGAATLAFWKAVCSWQPELGYGLATHCWLPVHGASSDARKQLRKRGIAGESLLQRIALNQRATPSEQKSYGNAIAPSARWQRRLGKQPSKLMPGASQLATTQSAATTMMPRCSIALRMMRTSSVRDGQSTLVASATALMS